MAGTPKQTESKKRKRADEIKVEPGADKRLANILRKALNTPPRRQAGETAPTRKPKK